MFIELNRELDDFENVERFISLTTSLICALTFQMLLLNITTFLYMNKSIKNVHKPQGITVKIKGG